MIWQVSAGQPKHSKSAAALSGGLVSAAGIHTGGPHSRHDCGRHHDALQPTQAPTCENATSLLFFLETKKKRSLMPS